MQGPPAFARETSPKRGLRLGEPCECCPAGLSRRKPTSVNTQLRAMNAFGLLRSSKDCELSPALASAAPATDSERSLNGFHMMLAHD